MRGLTIVKSLLVRVFLLAHALVCCWRVIDTNENQYCWIILIGLGFLLVETGIVIWLRNGHEFQTVAFSIIFYLSCVIPSLWLIHIETANRKLYNLAEDKLNSRANVPTLQSRQQNLLYNTTVSSDDAPSSPSSSSPSPSKLARLLAPTTPVILPTRQIECNDKAWYYMDEQRWLDGIQETLLIVLCISRVVISREYMTIPKSGIILFITLINGADLLAVSNSLQYHDMLIERLWMYIGLVLLSIGLFQMGFIDTDGLTPILDRTMFNKNKSRKRIHFLQDESICPLFRSLFINDGLLLLFRTLLAIKVPCSKPAIIFFMAKNVLVMTLHCYRVYRISKDRHKKKKFAAYEQLINTSTLSRKYRHPFYSTDRDRLRKQQKAQQRLLHRTLHKPVSISHRRTTKSPRTLRTLSLDSVSYPFARRRNDGGGARTAFALYGLPFQASQVPRPATISSTSSVMVKALVH